MALLSNVFSPWTTAGVAAILLLYLALSGKNLRRNGVALRKPRDTLLLLGNGFVFLQPRQKLFSWFTERERQEFGYETYQISVPTLPPGVVINDPANVDYVFKNDSMFTKGEFVKQRSWDLFGHGIINADGDLWKAQRKAGLHFLNTPNLRVLTDVALPRYLTSSIELLKSHADGAQVVDLQAVFHEITSRLMGKMAYNMEMHADDSFTLAFEYASGATAERFQNPLYFVTELFLGAKFRRSIAIVKSYGKSIVASAVRDRDAGTEILKGPDRASDSSRHSPADRGEEADRLEEISGSLIQSLLDSIGDEKMVADAALNYLSAGRDTVAQALTWTFYLLLQNPQAVDKIRQEVCDALLATAATAGEEYKAQPLPLDTTCLSPSSMPYTMAVFYEAMRLFPPIPIEIRQCVQATTLPDGTFLPESSILLWSLWAMGRSRHTWGPDADLFRPERWLSPPSSIESSPKPAAPTFVARSPCEYPVFNGGSHTCLGKKMAELIAVQVVPAVVWSFDLAPAYDERRPRVSKSSLTLPMEGGLPCFVKERSAASAQGCSA